MFVLVGSSGIIVDTSGIIDKDTGYDLITNIVSDYESKFSTIKEISHSSNNKTNNLIYFSVNLLLVLGNERLFASLSKKFKAKKQNLTCLKLPKSGGVVDRDDKFTRAVQRKMIGEYFYGSPVKMGMGLSPYSITVDYNDMTIYKSSQRKYFFFILDLCITLTKFAFYIRNGPWTEFSFTNR